MWDFILQIVYFLIAVGIIGALITFVVSRMLGDKENPSVKEERETKILRLQRELEKTSDQLQSQRDRLLSIEAALGESANMLKARDAQIKELRAELLSYKNIETELGAKKTEMGSLNYEMSTIRARLLEAENELRNSANPDSKMFAEINSLKKSLSGKDHEITLLLNRVKELAPLTLQIRDRELRIRELEKNHADELNARNTAIANLSARINDLESKQRSVEPEAKMEHPKQRPPSEDATEIALLKKRLNDLETMHILVVHPPPKEQWDDLVAINGVGPRVVKLLHRLGVYNFKQVAKWNDEQIDWVDSQLERFHGLIRRKHWVESAKNEHYKKYGERL